MLYLLLILHVALLLALPVAAWVLAPLVRRLTVLGRLPRPAPWLGMLALALVEYSFLFRARRLWGRLRPPVAAGPDHGSGPSPTG